MPAIRWVDIVAFLPELLKGARWTVLLTFAIITISVTAAIFVALVRMSRFLWLRVPAIAYVEFIRGTPALMQLYYIFYVLPFFGLTLPAIIAGIVGLSINYTAYLSEVYRAAIMSVPKVQVEAAESLGMTYWQSTWLVVIPQATRVALPPTVNYLLGLFKDTSLLSVITIQELMFRGLILGSLTFKYLTVFTVVAIMYFIICYPWALLATWLEHRLRAEPAAVTVKAEPPTAPVNP